MGGMSDHIIIDGSLGEGGGQIVRSSLTLSLVTGRPFIIENLRARRARPGLMRQHLTAVKAAAAVGRAHVEGAEIGSSRLVFEPNEVTPGEYDFQIGSAGSATLVAQTVLPALWSLHGPSVLHLEGGTHNPFAPPYDFLEKTYLPLVARMGPQFKCAFRQYGFYPAGGGEFTISLQPSPTLERLDLLERGELLRCGVRTLVANLPRHIAERECATIARESGWDESCFQVEEVASAGPGNVVMIELEFANITEVFAAVGEKGVKAEAVAARVWGEARAYLESGVPVDEHLADQLLLPLGLSAWRDQGCGRYRTGPLSQHAHTHMEVLQMFLGVPVFLEQEGEAWLVQVGE